MASASSSSSRKRKQPPKQTAPSSTTTSHTAVSITSSNINSASRSEEDGGDSLDSRVDSLVATARSASARNKAKLAKKSTAQQNNATDDVDVDDVDDDVNVNVDVDADVDVDVDVESNEIPASSSSTSSVPNKTIRLVFPGDKVEIIESGRNKIGLGLSQQKDSSVIACKAGILRQVDSKQQPQTVRRMWIDNVQKRYIAMTEDLVIGTVIDKHPDNYLVDIGTSQPARLAALAFEGATKRNKPNIQIGGLVYCRVEIANKDVEAELTCISPFSKKEWVTGQALFGELCDGFVFECSLSLARSLLNDDCFVLKCLGKHIPFEMAVGLNGRVWVNSLSALHIVIITNAILNSENMNNRTISVMVDKLLASLDA